MASSVAESYRERRKALTVAGMNLPWALFGALTGLLLGWPLRHVVARYVPPPRFVVEFGAAVVLALVFGRYPGQWEALAFGVLGAVGVALAVIDIGVQRLPHRLTLPTYPVVIGLLALAAAAEGDFAAFGRALLGGLALAGGYYVLAILRAGQLGGGDIVLAGLLGLVLGWLGWPVLVVGAGLGFVLFAVTALFLLASRRITLRSHVAFGPFMLAGALVAVLAI